MPPRLTRQLSALSRVNAWGVPSIWATAVLGLAVLHPSDALAVAETWVAVSAIGVLSLAVLLVSRHRSTPRVAVPGLSALVLVSGVLDLAPITTFLLFELVFVGTLEARGVRQWAAWSVASAVSAVTTLGALRAATDSGLASALAFQNLTLVALAAWWAWSLRRARECRTGDPTQRSTLTAVPVHEDVDARSARAIGKERLRLARDMHDVVAGRLAAISLQAALASGETCPVSNRATALQIKACATDTLHEVREMIASLRHGGRAPVDLERSRRRLHGTAATARALGVDLDVREDLEHLEGPAAEELYVIAHEVLVNIINHAAPCRAALVAGGDPASVVLHAWNSGTHDVPADGPGPPPLRGWGLANMEARVAPFGGTVDAGARQGGWFVGVMIPRVARPEPAPAPPMHADGAIPAGAIGTKV